MDSKYLILILLCQSPNNIFFSETEAFTTEQQPPPTVLTSSMLYVTTNSQNTTENALSQTTQVNASSGRQLLPAKITPRQPKPAVYVSSTEPVLHTSARPLVYNITRQAISTVNNSFPQTSLPGFTLANQPSSSIHNSSSQSPRPLVYTSTQQPRLPAPTPSRKPVLQTVHNPPIKPTPTIYSPRISNSPQNTPLFTSEPTSGKGTAHKTNHNALAAILIATIIISMLVAMLMIILWKYLRKPVLNDQNWAGRSPFADGETPDICMDNIRENEVSIKRTSFVSLMTWKPNKSTLLADDLEVKLFESSDSNNLKAESVKDQVNGVSEDSADQSTIGTAVSSSDDADLPLPPPPLDLDGNPSDKPTMVTVSPLPNESTNFQSSSDNQACKDLNSKIKQPFPPPPDSNLPLPAVNCINSQESNHEIQGKEFSTPDFHQDLTDSLPPPPPELL
ncbi:protein EVI2B [Phodopus roborovskii]|uniref:Unknown_gene_9840 protein n=1 Tax=Phodopus roborovskii TaxID=109678 RepID=A0AAU9YZB2_PHORO|nr:protein EVI2B [Phodopus roborovskii]CAH6785816.1 unknown_gene_9840 [Phodopus roborovskii]